MDALSKILSLYPPQTALDVRCHFGAPWVLEHPAMAAGTAPYHLLTKGQASLQVAGRDDVPLAEGDIVVFPRGEAHRIYGGQLSGATQGEVRLGDHPLRLVENGGQGEPADVLCGEFRFGPDAEPLLRSLPPVMVVRTAEQRNLRALMDVLQSEAESERPGATAVLSQLAAALFALLLRAWMEQQEPAPGLFGVLADRRLHAALEAMMRAPEAPWTLEQLAELCFMSRATFARLFAKAAGMPPAEMLTQLRMQTAAQLLGHEGATAARVAEAVGYQSEAAFSRAFSRHHGVGPGEFKRRLRA
ncbi:cupin domain-containing protein [Pseudoduganella sp. RAF19]|uniref:cupin domain-containing protein n=3 Tax=unclassified Pseudoduganella TaxID=2637179 RepID=UPI003F981A63